MHMWICIYGASRRAGNIALGPGAGERGVLYVWCAYQVWWAGGREGRAQVGVQQWQGSTEEDEERTSGWTVPSGCLQTDTHTVIYGNKNAEKNSKRI